MRDYFDRYQSSQKNLDAIINALYEGQDELRRDNADIEQEKVNLWSIMGRLRQYVYLGQQLDAQLSARIASIEATDPERAKVLKEDLLFPVRQKVQDLLTQLAVSVQGYLALDLIRRNNVELIKGVDRATTTTVSALRTAVIVAQALGDQKLVLDQITALNTTTGDLIASTGKMLRQQSADISQQASSATVDVAEAPAGLPGHLRDHGPDRHLQGEGARQHAEDHQRALDRGHALAVVPRSRPRQEGVDGGGAPGGANPNSSLSAS